MSIGIITHLGDPTVDDVRELAFAAEQAGADWVGVPDAFWWRDAWILAWEAIHATRRVEVGPLVTNPYTRHPFQTIAALATLQGLAPDRTFLGIGAGGSEVTGAAGIPRTDAPARIVGLVERLRAVADGAPLDDASGRRLEVPLRRPSVLVAGRAGRVLEVAGRVADRALLWAVPRSELAWSIERIDAGVAEAGGPRSRPELIWAPLVAHDDTTLERIRATAAYSVLNSRPARQRAWGLDTDDVRALRAALVAGGASAAADQVPGAAFEDLVIADPDPRTVGREAATLGITGIALPGWDVSTVRDRVQWAREVLDVAAAAAVAA